MLRNRVQEFRELHGFSQTELAERCGLQRSVIGNLESIDGYLTNMSTALRLCTYFKCDIGRMFYIDWAAVAAADPKLPIGDMEEVPA